MSASALYEGVVSHRRTEPVEHAFSYRVFMMLLDLDELPGVLEGSLLSSARRPAPVRFRRSDYLGDPARPLGETVRELVERRTGERPDGPIRLLTNLRMFGTCFNPVSFYYCFDAAGDDVRFAVAEVTNTPWGERHAYVIRAAGEELRGGFDKELHVSPFMGMNHRYDIRLEPPSDALRVEMSSGSDGRRVFEATLALRRRELTPAALRRIIVRYPFMTARVLARIYRQAVRLRLKGVAVHPNPSATQGTSA